MNDSDQRGESSAERAGIVDQQDAALEAMEEDGVVPDGDDPAEKGPDVGPMADDPMEGEAPSG